MNLADAYRIADTKPTLSSLDPDIQAEINLVYEALNTIAEESRFWDNHHARKKRSGQHG